MLPILYMWFMLAAKTPVEQCRVVVQTHPVVYEFEWISCGKAEFIQETAPFSPDTVVGIERRSKKRHGWTKPLLDLPPLQVPDTSYLTDPQDKV